MADEVKFDPELRKRYSKVRLTVKETIQTALQSGSRPSDIKSLRKGAAIVAEIKNKDLEESVRKREEAEKDKELAQLEGRTDPLTGLRNVRGFNESLRSEIERSIRNGQILGLIAIDLDNLKMVNDKYGHHKGDEVLKAVANIINDHAPGKESVTRTIDIAARTGGDELFIISPDIKGGLELAAGRIRLALEKKIKESVPGIEDIPISASVGAASISPEEKKGPHYEEIEKIMEQLKSQADIALYVSKHGGKNKLTIYQEGMIMPQGNQV